jgi:hypothetical protein
MGTSTLQYLLLMQFPWKKPAPKFKVCWQICYENNHWNVCADLKVVALLTGLQGGCTTFCWDSRARDTHCHVKQWPLRGEMIVGQKNVAHRALVDNTKIYLPPLHIKVGLMKIFVKAKYIKRIRLFKANISTYERGQDKRRHFRRSSSRTAFSRPRIQK